MTEDHGAAAAELSAQPAVWAVVPIKRLTEAKQRLAGILDSEREAPRDAFREAPREASREASREAFAFRLACRTLDVLGECERLAGVIVVTPDARIAEAARARGSVVIDDGGVPLNEAVTLGLRAARAQRAAVAVVLPCDLPTLTAATLEEVVSAYLALRARDGAHLVGLVRCKDGTGTNLVMVDPALDFRPSFGVGSFAAHLEQARGHGHELQAPAVAFDVDSPDDLRSFAAALTPDEGARSELARWVMERELLSRAGSQDLAAQAAALRDRGFDSLITYSRKVFLPLTQLCRDSCHYCTFAKAPKRLPSPYMGLEEAVAVAAEGARLGCQEALFTLGDRPELRYRVAAQWLAEHGFASTLDYVAHVAAAVRDRTGLLPHINAGCMSGAEMALLRPVCASMGLMLESTAARLCAKGGPHFGSPDKDPAVRLATLEEAGRQRIPFTTGILIGIGETRQERIEALLAIRALHARHGHIQEIIIQNFVPKPGTIMAHAAPPAAEELLWSIAAARIVFGPHMSIQAPPNLSPAPLPRLIEAGINDWGGVSPLTPDFVNPESRWPEIERLRAETALAGKTLTERLTVYPAFARAPRIWLDEAMRRPVLEHSDGGALGREDSWRTGRSTGLPPAFAQRAPRSRAARASRIAQLLERVTAHGAESLDSHELAALFEARGADFHRVCEAADALRSDINGEVATYVVNRNINYTNICGYRCTFCAFSKGTRRHAGAERGYLLDVAEIVGRSLEACARGATEVCLQGGIHPSFTGETYLEILRAVKRAAPALHVHAFSPLEVWHGAGTLGMTLKDYLGLLRAEGLGSLPGTAAEILVDAVREVLCPDKLSSAEWLQVIETAHDVGLPTTATIMFGHVDTYHDWALHLEQLRDLQKRTHGFTEFVPLPFVAHEAPLYKRGRARPGPTLRESILMHAVARLALNPYFTNIQASWVKLGRAGMREALRAGANDLGGTLMNESITRAAGATHGQEMTPQDMLALAHSLGREPRQRTTLYQRAPGAVAATAAHVAHAAPGALARDLSRYSSSG